MPDPPSALTPIRADTIVSSEMDYTAPPSRVLPRIGTGGAVRAERIGPARLTPARWDREHAGQGRTALRWSVNRAARHRDALSVELGPDLAGAVDAVVLGVHLSDLAGQPRVALTPRRGRRGPRGGRRRRG